MKEMRQGLQGQQLVSLEPSLPTQITFSKLQ